MWNMGTDQSKARIASRLQTGGIHFSENLPSEVFDEVTAEVLTVTRRNGRVARQWRLKVGKKRNEALDCLGMAFASLHILKPKWLRTSESKLAARKFVQAKRLEQAEKKTVDGNQARRLHGDASKDAQGEGGEAGEDVVLTQPRISLPK